MQEELRLRARLIRDAEKNGFYARSVNDRFVSGYPDMRVSRRDTGPVDVELKVLNCSLKTWENGDTIDSGVSALQKIELREMNASGIRAFALILVPVAGCFVFCNFPKINLSQSRGFGTVDYRETPKNAECADWNQIITMGIGYIRSIA